MINNHRYCVIMCGGIGSRFWPYSRTNRPKQFIDFLGTGRTLLQMSYDRVLPIVPKENVIVVTNAQYAPLVKERLVESALAVAVLEVAPTRVALKLPEVTLLSSAVAPSVRPLFSSLRTVTFTALTVVPWI